MINKITQDIVARALAAGDFDIHGEKFLMRVNDLYTREINERLTHIISEALYDIVDAGSWDDDVNPLVRRVCESTIDEILDRNPELQLNENWLEEAERQKEAGVQLQLF